MMRWLVILLLATAVQAGPAYPLKLKSGAHYMVDQNGTPFFVQGQSPWFFQTALNYSDTKYYLSNINVQAYNSIILDLTYANGNASGFNDFYGHSPFTNTISGGWTDFSTPDVRYFTNLDNIILLAGSYGINVFGYPLYDGFAGSQWYVQMQHSSSNALWTFGNFIGTRYKNFTNVVWIGAGDDTEANSATTNDLWSIVAKGLVAGDPNHLLNAQAARNAPATTYGWVTVNSSYPSYFTYVESLRTYKQSPVIASFDREPYYINRSGIATFDAHTPPTYTLQASDARAFFWWSALQGDSGCFFGDDGTTGWQFGTGWQAALWGSGPTTCTNVYQCLRTRPWWNLVPDTNSSVVTSPGTVGTQNYIVCARDVNGETVIAYTMTNAPNITVAMTNLARWYSVGWWYNPRTGAATYIGQFTNTGNQTFTPPDNNDWTLVLDSTAPGFTAPGDLTLIPTNRMVPWVTNVTVGVSGGIPWTLRTNLIDVTQAPYNADNTGASDAKTAIQNAINATASNDVVYLPAGKYLLSSGGLTINNAHNGISVRGVMSNGTNASIIINLSSAPAIAVGVDPIQVSQASIFKLNAASWKGSSSLVLATNKDQFNQSLPTAPWLATLYQANDGNGWGSDYMPQLQIQGNNGVIKQRVWTSSFVNSATPTLTLSHPLSWDFTNTSAYVVIDSVGGSSLGPVQKVGIEYLGFFGTNNAGSSGTAIYQVKMEDGKDCWFVGNEIYWNHNYGLYWQYMVGGEVSSNVIHQQDAPLNQSNHSGLLVANDTGSLIQNNIIYNVFPGIEFNDGFNGNAIFANFLTNCTTEILCHNTHPLMNLWEQNKCKTFEMDGYFGSQGSQTLFRNRFYGTTVFKRWNTFHNLVGNVLVSTNSSYIWSSEVSGYTSPFPAVETGFPSIGNNLFTGSSPPQSWDFPQPTYADFTGATRTNGSITFTNTQVSTNVFYGGTFTNYPSSYDASGVHFVDYPIAFQDSADTNKYWRWADFSFPYDGKTLEITNTGSIISGTSTNVPTDRIFTVSNTWTLWAINQNCYQQLQATNKYTDIFAQNLVYTNAAGSIIQDVLIADTFIQSSLLYSNGAPSWWKVSGTNAPFPAIGPDLAVPSGLIPAEARFLAAPVSDPAITVQPNSQTVTAPATATFSVTATGTAPVAYQWYRGGVSIGGANSSNYTTPPTTTGDNGSAFYVIVTSAKGSLQSSTVTLTVNSGGGGTAPTYNWTGFGGTLGSGTR